MCVSISKWWPILYIMWLLYLGLSICVCWEVEVQSLPLPEWVD